MSIANIFQNVNAQWNQIECEDIAIDGLCKVDTEFDVSIVNADEIEVNDETEVTTDQNTGLTLANELQVIAGFNPWQVDTYDIQYKYSDDAGLTVSNGLVLFKTGSTALGVFVNVPEYAGTVTTASDRIDINVIGVPISPSYTPAAYAVNIGQEIGYHIFNPDKDSPSIPEEYLIVVWSRVTSPNKFLMRSIVQGNNLTGTGAFKFQFPANLNAFWITDDTQPP